MTPLPTKTDFIPQIAIFEQTVIMHQNYKSIIIIIMKIRNLQQPKHTHFESLLAMGFSGLC